MGIHHSLNTRALVTECTAGSSCIRHGTLAMDSTAPTDPCPSSTSRLPTHSIPNVHATVQTPPQKYCRAAVPPQEERCIAALQVGRRREAIDELRGRRLNLQFAAVPGQTVELLRLGSAGTLRLVPVKGESVGFSSIGNDRSTCKSVSTWLAW